MCATMLSLLGGRFLPVYETEPDLVAPWISLTTLMEQSACYPRL